MNTASIEHDINPFGELRTVPAVPINSVAVPPKYKRPRRDFRAFVALSSLATTLGVAPAMAATSSIASNFNGTSIPLNNWLWFNSHVASLPAVGQTYHIYVVNASVTIQDGANSHVIAIPDATLTFAPLAPEPVFAGSSTGTWATTYGERVYLDLLATGNNPFISGVGYKWDQAFDPAGANPVTWRADFFTDSALAAAQGISWQWSAAVYTNFSGDISQVSVTALDGAAGFSQSGTPANFSPFVTGGARGGGGSNFTGSNSGTGTAVLGLIPEPGTASLTALALWSCALWRRRHASRGVHLIDYGSPCTDATCLQ
jgi:hypothetical protein